MELLLGLLLLAPPAQEPVRGSAAPSSLTQRTAGLTRHDGYLPFYWDARQGLLLLEPRLDEDLFYSFGLAGGAGVLEASLDRGDLGGLALCRFERVGPRVLLHQRQTRQRSGVADAERTRVVSESFPSAVLAALPIVAEEGGRVLVDATDFLLMDAAVLAQLRGAGQGEWKQDAARSTLRLERSGAFPRNTEIEALLTFVSDDPGPGFADVLPDGRSMSLLAHHTFLKPPEPGFEPRPLDPRVGFIPEGYKDHTAPFTEPIERQLAARWRLVKQDPSAAVSEPVEPIVFHLDRGMPEPERSAVRDAALWWNHAFEAAGFRNALVVRDLPEGATFLDARYSGIEWINRTERAWSIGATQTDPRTGEILHAVARIDSHRRRTTSRLWRNLERPPARDACRAADAAELAWLAPLAAGESGVDEESLVLQRLAYLSAHEVGHTLGIGHNWAATTFGWGSVMDYLAANVQLREGRLDLADAYPRDVGSYDRLAIQWGYTPGADPAHLDAIVRDGYAKGIVHPLENDARWAEYDWGPDPVEWLRTTQAVRREILARFGAGQLKPGTPVHELTVRFSLAYLYHRFGIQAAQQHVGGYLQANALAGDGQTPTAGVPARRQRQALDLLLAALAPENLEVPERILPLLVPEPSGTRPTRERFVSEAGALFSPLSAARALANLIVRPLLEPQRAARLTLASGPDALTLDGLLGRLLKASWGAPPDATAAHAALRRVAQRAVLDALLDLAAHAEAAPEVRAQAVARLARLRSELRLRKGGDAESEAHLRLAERDVQEFLERPELRKERRDPLPAPPGRPIG
jgi:hypothetical protein